MRPLAIALMLESDGPGGAEIVLYDLATELRSRGHRVVPVGPADGVGWLGDKLRGAGFDVETYAERRPPDLRLVWRLAQVLRQREIDVVHSHEFTMAVYGAAAARLSRIPHVVTMHGNQGMTRALRRRLALRWMVRASTSVVAVSGATQRQLISDLGLRSSAIGVVRNGIPRRKGDAEAVRTEFSIAPSEVVILAVGNLDVRKGHYVLLQALDQLERQGPQAPWRLIIAGGRGGPELPRLEEFARDRGWEARVHVLGHRDDIPNLQAAADIFAMPSLWEGLPLALLEAMFASNAIVASDTSGIPEAIVDAREGRLVPPGNATALAQALGELLGSPTERERLGNAALQRANGEFTLTVMGDAYEALYRAALGTRSSAGAGAA